MSPDRQALLDGLVVERARPLPPRPPFYDPDARQHRRVLEEALEGFVTPTRAAAPVVDDIAVERALGGDRSVRLTREEFAEAVARGTRRGLSANDIGVALGVTKRTVTRHRTATDSTEGAQTA